jgi:predicted enzyme related to lactoylglutathione lyase
MPDSSHGRFLWYQLNTSDLQGAQDFYTAIVGWGTERWEGPDGPYTMWTADGEAIGGLYPLPDDAEAPPHWLAYVGVDDVDSSLDRALRMGAHALVPAEDMAEVGRMAVIADPQGAAIALFTPVGEPPAQGSGPGHFGWHELAADDAAAALDFYTHLFGWEQGSEFDMGDGWIYHMLRRPGDPSDSIAIFRRPPEMQSSAWLYYVETRDADSTAEAAVRNGGAILNGPMEVPGGDRIAQCTDPQGGAFAIMSRATARDAVPG